jgi:hypothetical protein
LGVSNWLRWLEAEIHPEVMTMNLHRHVFRELGAIVERNGTLPPSYSFEFDLRDQFAGSASRRRGGRPSPWPPASRRSIRRFFEVLAMSEESEMPSTRQRAAQLVRAVGERRPAGDGDGASLEAVHGRRNGR